IRLDDRKAPAVRATQDVVERVLETAVRLADEVAGLDAARGTLLRLHVAGLGEIPERLRGEAGRVAPDAGRLRRDTFDDGELRFEPVQLRGAERSDRNERVRSYPRLVELRLDLLRRESDDRREAEREPVFGAHLTGDGTDVGPVDERRELGRLARGDPTTRGVH